MRRSLVISHLMEKVGHGCTRSGDSSRAGGGVSVAVDDVAASAPTPQATGLEEHEASEGSSLDSIDLVNAHQVGKKEQLLAWLSPRAKTPTTSSRTCNEKPRPMLFHVHQSYELFLGNLACHFMWKGDAEKIGAERVKRRAC